MEKKIESVKKIHDAQTDIEELDIILKTYNDFHHCANDLFNRLNKNIDYQKYVLLLKVTKGMAGNKQFYELSYIQKVRVLKMYKEAISLALAEYLKEAAK